MVEESLSWKCPECGVDISPNAAGCSDCGAMKENGLWIHSASGDGLDLPNEDDFNYEEFIQREFGGGEGRKKKTPIEILWWVVAVIILVSFGMIAFGFF